jgi:antimicrobial peptide system SdpB family protein
MTWHTPGYGLARSLLALATLCTFVFNSTELLFYPTVDEVGGPVCTQALGINLFCLLKEHLGLARVLTIVILLVVIAGWKPRYTGILHWWVCYSWVNSSLLVDGGDHVNAVLTLLLIPVTVTDHRRWHWSPVAETTSGSTGSRISPLVAFFSLKVIRIQVAAIYLHAAFAKCAVPEWQNGTALYYWFTDPTFGVTPWLEPLILPLILHPFSVALLTWGTILFEFLLFAGLLAKKAYRPLMLFVGIGFHMMIALIHGLVTFGLSMSGALLFYLGSPEKSIQKGYFRLRI